MDNKKGILIVLSGPSGTGKDSILREMKKYRNDFQVSVSCTTRLPREGEVNSKDYFFISKQEFMDMVEKNLMLEWANFCGNYYGTPKNEIDKLLDSGINVILEIEVQGARQIIEKCPNAVSIFVLPPSLQILGERLRNRGLDADEIVERRLQESKHEIGLARSYDYVVVNDNLEECAKDILKIIDIEGFKVKNRKNFIERVLRNERVVSR